MGLTGRIVFTRAGGEYGDETVFVANIDGSREHQLGTKGASGGPWVGRDGSTVAIGAAAPDGRFTAMIVSLDGSNPQILPLPPGTLNLGDGPFSPDGKRILREGFDDAHTDAAGAYVSNVDGSHITRLTTRHFIPADWSPDGKHLLLFDSNVHASDPPAPGALYIADADGTHLRQLTKADVLVQCCFNYRWSPDGSSVLFADQAAACGPSRRTGPT